MEYIFELVKIKIQDMSLDGKQIRRLERICQNEKEFLKDLSKEKQDEYRKLEWDKLEASGLETDRIIELTIKITKDIYK